MASGAATSALTDAETMDHQMRPGRRRSQVMRAAGQAESQLNSHTSLGLDISLEEQRQPDGQASLALRPKIISPRSS
jgi:hypothetical protein